MSCLSRTLVAVGCLLLLLCCSIPGGLTNRARGGWLVLSYDPWPAHLVLQLVEAGPLALVVLVCGLWLAYGRRERNIKSSFTVQRAWILAIVMLVVTELSLFAGWGCYFGIGTNEAPAIRIRVGIFDWLIGLAVDNSSYGERWMRDMVGMSWRGLFWTAPTGVLYAYYDLGWLSALSGVWMGLIYYFAQYSPHGGHNFEQGIPMAELMWGIVIWLTTLLPLLRPAAMIGNDDANEESALLSDHRSPSQARGLITRTSIERNKRCNWIMTYIVLMFLENIWLASAIYYSTSDPYRSAFGDEQHRHEELLGWQRSVVSVWGIWFASIFMHIILVYRFGLTGEKERRRQEGDVSFYDSEHLLPITLADTNHSKKPKTKALEPSDSPMLRAALAANQSRPLVDVLLIGMADIRRVLEVLTIIAFITLIGLTGVVTVLNVNHPRS